MVVGAQECGTTALWEYLGAHPQVGMSSPKEVHLFDSEDYSPEWTPQQIDKRYARWFRHASPGALLGEATPIYSYLPEVAAQLQRYNPNLRLILLLRDSAERAISHYYMQKARNTEQAPFWLALILEPWRVWRCKNPRRKGSATRLHCYRGQGLYSRQLRNLYRHFPTEQVLLIHVRELLHDHQAVLRRAFAFLGVAEDITMPARIAMSGEAYGKRHHPILSWLLRLSYFIERRRARGLYSLEDAKERH